MSVEAKFAVADETVIGRLASVAALAGYQLEPAVARCDDDLYLDTADRRLLLARLCLRLRRSDQGLTLVLRQLAKPGSEGLLRRQELEGSLDPSGIRSLVEYGQTSLDHIPPGPLYRRLAAVVRTGSLGRILALRQDRRVRVAQSGRKAMISLDLDVVTVRSIDGAPRWAEAKIALLPDGAEDDLQRLGAVLRTQWRLTPRGVSKFEHGLSLVEEEM